MARDDTGQLVVAERFEIARRGQMPFASLALGERPVCDLTDERLDERVLAAGRCARIRLDREDLAPNEQVQPWGQAVRGLARDCAGSVARECDSLEVLDIRLEDVSPHE